MLGPERPDALPEDPVLARLLPDAYGDDPEAAGEFRRYTERACARARSPRPRTVLATLPGDGRPGPADRRATPRPGCAR